MKPKTLLFKIKIGEAAPRPFQEIRVGEAFVWGCHVEMIEPYVEIKVSETHAAELGEVMREGFEEARLYEIDKSSICYPVT